MGSRLVGTSSAERTLDQRDLSSLRPARENAPRPRKPSVLREVTTGIVCFCGERFGEHQALEFMLHLRAEVGEVLDWRERTLTRKRELQRQMRADPERWERELVKAREYWQRRHADPQYRERELAKGREYQRQRYADPQYRERLNARRRELRAERIATDPQYREREKARRRERHQKEKAEREAAPG